MKLEVFNINGKSLGREVELPADIFGLELNEKHEHIVYLAVKQYLAHQRQGTHKSKERNEVAGSTRKLHRQKGTGGSRKGAITNPLYRGGGRVFGPRPRTYTLKMNKKVSRLARKVALTSKATKNRIFVIEDFTFEAPKTKNYLSFLQSMNVEGEKCLADVKSLMLLNAPTLPQAPKEPRLVRARGRKKAMQPELNKAYEAACATYNKEVESYDQALTQHEAVIDNTYNNIVLSCRNIPNADVLNAKDLNVYEVMNADYVIITESAIAKINEVLSK